MDKILLTFVTVKDTKQKENYSPTPPPPSPQFSQSPLYFLISYC